MRNEHELIGNSDQAGIPKCTGGLKILRFCVVGFLTIVAVIVTSIPVGCGPSTEERRQAEEKAAKEARESQRQAEEKAVKEARESQRKLVQALVDKHAEINRGAAADLKRNPEGVEDILRSASAKLKDVDLAGCPQDVKEAVIDYLSALDVVVFQLSRRPKSLMAQLDTITIDLWAGRSLDSTIKQGDERVIKAGEHLEEAKVKLQKILLKYDAK